MSWVQHCAHYIPVLVFNLFWVTDWLLLNRARILAAAGSVDYLIFSFLAYFVIERYGRRRVMMASAFACSTCWTIISISLGLSETGKANEYIMGCIATTGFFMFFASFGLGVLGVPVR